MRRTRIAHRQRCAAAIRAWTSVRPDGYPKPEAHGIAGDKTREAIAIGEAIFPANMRDALPDDIRVPMALLARCVSTAKTSLHLAELETQFDAFVCLRTLYDHTVMLAWLLGPGDSRLDREKGRRTLLWERYCDVQAVKLDREMTAAGGESLLSDDARAAIGTAAAVDLGPPMPGVADMALVADREWDDRVRAVDPDRGCLLPMRSLYTAIYRPASSFAHPTLTSVQALCTRSPGAVQIHLERPDPTLHVLPMVPALLAMGYLATAHFIRQPALETVEGFIRSFGYRPSGTD